MCFRCAFGGRSVCFCGRCRCVSSWCEELFLISLWRHECQRTFTDKLINYADKKTFCDMLDRVTKEKFRDSLGFEDEQLMTDTIFCDFQRDDEIDEYGDIT